MSNTKKYWKGIEELQESPEFVKIQQNEFSEEIPVDQFIGNDQVAESNTNRRDFLKVLGFSVTAASLAACEAPVRRVIPYLNKPEEITPGVANYYASSYWDGQDFASIVVKTREGRPIKVDGNELCEITKGGSNARLQASVLSLYDTNRLKGPEISNTKVEWAKIDSEVSSKLNAISARGGNIRILTSTIISPSLNAAIGDFTAKYPTTQVVTYDTVSYKAISDANAASFGKKLIPTYSFDKADVVVGIGCDFLANWLSPIEYGRQYAAKRKLNQNEKKMSRHVQIESVLTVTGSNADKRIAVKPSELGLAAVNLLNKLTGGSLASRSLNSKDAAIASLAAELNAARGRALVVCGVNDVHVQQVVNAINSHLGSYGNTINTDVPDLTRQGDDVAVMNLVSQMNAGQVDALFIHGVNPVYTLPDGAGFKAALAKVDLTVSLSDRKNETALACKVLAPDNHYLESWTDAMPRPGHYTLGQPTISPLAKTRQALESFLAWTGNTLDAHDYIARHWETTVFPSAGGMMFSSFWSQALHDGVIHNGKSIGSQYALMAADSKSGSPTTGQSSAPIADKTLSNVSLAPIPDDATLHSDIHNDHPAAGSTGAALSEATSGPVILNAVASVDAGSAASAILAKAGKASGVELVIYQKTGMGTGDQASNPWLQELPDPITKVTWDNYLMMNPSEMDSKNFNMKMGQQELAATVEITANGKKITLPVVAQPGLPVGVVAVALGYGRTAAGKTADGVGQNAFPFVTFADGTFQYNITGVSVSDSNGSYHLACTQTHNTMMGREIVKEATLEEYKAKSNAGNEQILLATNLSNIGKDGKAKPVELDLWQNFEYKNHFWNMAIDLNSCIGCGACVVSCTAENNVPVVGKDEVRRSREMHWLRIDRYYSSDMNHERAEAEGVGGIEKFKKMEVPSAEDTLEVVFRGIL